MSYGAGGHGTHTSGTIVGSGAASDGRLRGIAYGSHLVHVGLVEGTISGFVRAMEWGAAQKDRFNIQVASISLGVSTQERDFAHPDHALNAATRALFEKGIAVAIAAGNCGDGSAFPLGSGNETVDEAWEAAIGNLAGCNPAPVENPDGTVTYSTQMNPISIHPWVIAVGAGCKAGTNDSLCQRLNGQGVLTSQSSRGVPGDELEHPDIIAVGARLAAARASTTTSPSDPTRACTGTAAIDPALMGVDDAYICLSGTSMATPQVASAIALLEELTQYQITPAEAYLALEQSATQYPAFDRFEIGHGYLNVTRAAQVVCSWYECG